ncbi:MAG: outer membrane protein assembly factor BamB family protein [Candidatus Dormibacteria bacterium]
MQTPARARFSGRVRDLFGLLGLLAVLGLSMAGCGLPARPGATPSPAKVSPSPSPLKLPAAESGVLPWSLAAPLSRAVLLPGPGPTQLTILGGLTAGGGSAAGIYTLNTAGGALAYSGSLTGPLHDASGAILKGRDTVFGGGTTASSAAVQSLPATLGAAVPSGTLPQARSDSASAVIGGTAYVVGGYSGTSFDPTVLATTDGVTFSAVATLPIPVRYPAVATLGGQIYVFGGQTARGEPTASIQRIDPATHSAKVVGTLPEPVTGASAATLQGVLYVMGGETSAGGGTAPNPTIWAFDQATGHALAAGLLRVPVSHASIATLGTHAWLVGGESATGPVSTVQMLTPNLGFGTAGAPGAGSPFFGGDLLIADAGANRILLVNPAGQVIWHYPSATAPPPPGGFVYPDDAFFADHGTAIVMNMESYQEIVKIAYPSGRVLWTYGHPGVAGSAPGYLNTPDDAYQLKSGQISVADIVNCRVLIINPNGTLARQIGTTGSCVHRPPTHLGSPNGDTPLPNGNILISEINGSWVSEYTTTGQLVWTTHLHLTYPSDPQQIGPNRYLIAGYTKPGVIMEFNRQGQVLYRYAVASGPGALNTPSLVELLPSGAFMLNDDSNDRMIAIDPATGAAVWQYGVTGVSGTAPGLLNDPDGFDLLMANGSTPTHPGTG